MSMHPNQLIVTAETVGELVDQQFPEWATLPIERISSEGTVNAIFRIGAHIAARFPLPAWGRGDDAAVAAVRGRGGPSVARANPILDTRADRGG